VIIFTCGGSSVPLAKFYHDLCHYLRGDLMYILSSLSLLYFTSVKSISIKVCSVLYLYFMLLLWFYVFI